MQQKTPIAAIMLVLIILASCSGCLGGGKTGNETTSPLANSLLTVSPVEAMIGNTATLSCVLNTSNGQGLIDQVVYWYVDGKALGQSSTYFGFATYNLSVSNVSALSIGVHRIIVEYKGNADYTGSTGEGVLRVIPKSTLTPSTNTSTDDGIRDIVGPGVYDWIRSILNGTF
jgi:hypothetical protein